MKRLILTITLLLCVHGMALAQNCSIGVYGDPGGTLNYASSSPGEVFSIYVVIFAENTVAAAAYSLSYSSEVFLQARFAGPGQDGLWIDEPTGTNVALTECVIGFGGLPVLVDEYQFVYFDDPYGPVVTLGPNASQDPDLPQYVTCNDVTLDCEIGPALCVTCGLPTEDRSFGMIKTLFKD